MHGRVLLVVEDPRASRALGEELSRSRYTIDVCVGLRTALEKLGARRYEALVLDLDVTPADALRLAMEIRTRMAAPILLFPRESSLRTLAPLSTAFGYAPLHDGLELPGHGTERPPATRFGELVVDLAAMHATVRGTVLDLTPTEFKLLVALSERPGHVLSREELLLRVWNYTDGDGGRLIDVHVGRLRKKLRRAQVDDVRLETSRGFGYRLVARRKNVAPAELTNGPTP